MIKQDNWIKEELTIAEFSERFLLNNDYSTPYEFDISGLGIEILGYSEKDNKDCYRPINKFIIKGDEDSYYTDGNLIGTKDHRIIEHGKNIKLKNHSDFKKVDKTINVVDFDIEDNKNYYANGRLNHNTVSGGLAVQFAASTRIRLTKALKIKDKNKEIIGLYIKARIDKSRFGPSYRQVEFPLYFTSGIDDAGSLLIYLKNKQLIKSSGAWYTLQRIDAQTNETEEIKFMAKDWKNKLYKDKSLQEYVYKLICDNFIMKYQEKEEPIDIDSLEIESDLEPEQPFEKLNSNNKDIE